MLVLIVDSSIQIAERLGEIISEVEKITVVQKAVSYKEAKKLCKENRYDVVVLDSSLPANGSLRLLQEVKQNYWETCVIVLSNHADNYIQTQCKSLGADFFFDKYYDFEKIGDLLCSYHLEK